MIVCGGCFRWVFHIKPTGLLGHVPGCLNAGGWPACCHYLLLMCCIGWWCDAELNTYWLQSLCGCCCGGMSAVVEPAHTVCFQLSAVSVHQNLRHTDEFLLDFSLDCCAAILLRMLSFSILSCHVSSMCWSFCIFTVQFFKKHFTA